ncbi:Cholinesterase [Tetrabaena socialis]|uniref:Carboxylic ester hydrolase n=1 Tax=Tetrabaena socialis TaxID=47790 RepID=A0A2J8A6N0_9CHLO|nr:Cholinesterase [Tetrabaena socialis]|eukprot:PNH08174.1 Cholinesterase [Tetrabaena socialis]
MPPVGKLRFEAPVAYDTMYPAEGLDAKLPGPQCLQPEGGGSEDCLTLNIWKPAKPSTSPLPVRLFIHGGGYQAGSSGDPSLDGCMVVEDANVIYVTISYRLGVLGFLALPELKTAGNATGNWGLLDQRLALQWLQANIGAFGGDPSRVMINGQSAGGYSVLLHTIMPKSHGLFAAALPMSGSSDVMAVDFLGDAFEKGYRLRDALNCSEAAARLHGFVGTKECLQQASADDLLAAQIALQPDTVQQHIPCIDGVEIPKHPHTMMMEGRTLTPIPTSFEPWVVGYYNNQIFGSWLEGAIAAVTDAGYHCPARRVASLFAKQGLPARVGVVQAVRPGSVCPLTDVLFPGPIEVAAFMGAFHGYDVPMTLLKPYFSTCNYTVPERQLSSFMSGVFSAFSTSGEPLPPLTNKSTSPELANITSWPTWPAFLSIDATIPTLVSTSDILDVKCQLW